MKGSLLNKAGNSLRGIVCLQNNNNNNNEENQTLCPHKERSSRHKPTTYSLALINSSWQGKQTFRMYFLGV